MGVLPLHLPLCINLSTAFEWNSIICINAFPTIPLSCQAPFLSPLIFPLRFYLFIFPLCFRDLEVMLIFV